jgi:hypothetical protein
MMATLRLTRKRTGHSPGRTEEIKKKTLVTSNPGLRATKSKCPETSLSAKTGVHKAVYSLFSLLFYMGVQLGLVLREELKIKDVLRTC